MNRVSSLLAAAAAAFCLAGCATTDPSGQNDPYEHTNRQIFELDQDLDKAVMRPVAVFYNHAVPEFARDGVHNFLVNLNGPITIGNSVLQGDAENATRVLARITINSTVGIAGLIDVAAKIGLPLREEDFGQTLGVWGFDEGPYLVLPGLGPSNPRDVVGSVGDVFMDPLTYAQWHGKIWYDVGRQGLELVDLRARNVETLDQIERTSVDLYATTRSLYRQKRNSDIRNGAPDTENLPNL